MDNLRVVLWVALLGLLWITAQTWQRHFAPPVATPPSADGTVTSAPPMAGSPSLPSLAEPAQAPAAAEPVAASKPRLVSVSTDVLEGAIDLAGGDLRFAVLPAYPVHKDQPDVPVRLLSGDTADYFVFQTGLRAADGQPEPNHLANYSSAAESYNMTDDELLVPLTWSSGNGVIVEKIFRFRRGRYDVDMEYRIRNGSATPYRAAEYLQIQRLHQPPEQSMFDVETYSYVGPLAYDGEAYRKLDVDDLATAPFSQAVAGGWFAAIQHHFLVAAVPPASEVWTYDGRFSDGRFQVSAIGPLQTVPVAGTLSLSSRLFVGPKIQAQLAETAPDLDLTVDYGKLTLLAQPLFWLLQQVHDFVGNWGLSIIIVTLLIKLVFYKLTETSGRSMARMRTLAPRMKALQERHKDDRQALSQAMMDLYKREKVNPAAGCLPMLVQIPFFIAFYWVLLESVEMRQAPFALWITDLSSRDPYFVLPLLMGAAMWFQQKLNPAPPDPVQAKVMQLMPVMFTGFFAFFPSGLVLYWLTNSVLSIAQQWRINKVLGAD
jgi:YidC/Oxa1 family membrane protein insertase